MSRGVDAKGSFVIVGGGIAGVSCAQTLTTVVNLEEHNIILVTASSVIKSVGNLNQMTRRLASFDVCEVGVDKFEQLQRGQIRVICDEVVQILDDEKCILTREGTRIHYDVLCLCHGARPKKIAPNNPFVIGIRDTESVIHFQDKLKHSSRIGIVGNGGIATELVYELKAIDVVWAIKDSSIAATFVDPGAGQFFVDLLHTPEGGTPTDQVPVVKRMMYRSPDKKKAAGHVVTGSALGPDWHTGIDVAGCKKLGQKLVKVEYECEVARLYTHDEFVKTNKVLTQMAGDQEKYNIYMELSNGKVYGLDLIVSATGVVSNGDAIQPRQRRLDLDETDGGILVDDNMMTSVEDIFAAGDVCHASWTDAGNDAHNALWFQMRLWTQARQMGMHAALCMESRLLRGERRHLDFAFEMFTHVTKFFGFKVVLLGKFNGQGLGHDYEALVRVTKGKEYVKTVMVEGKMQGCVLIGETDLEETFENLILNQIDLSSYGEDLLSPDVDIEDYFD